MPHHRSFMRRLAFATAMVWLVMLAACGSGSSSKASPTPGVSPTAEAPEATATSQASSVQINKSFWHSGWKVTLQTATLKPGRTGSLAIDATFENVGEDDSSFDSQLVLVSGGSNYSESTLDQDLPKVPGGLKGAGKITFAVDEKFKLDDATLLVGNVANNQATVPIGPNGAKLVTLEPVQILVSGTIVAGALTLTVTGAELRADFPDTHRPVVKGKRALTIKFSATVAAGIQIGQGVLQGDAVALKLPDGTAVAVISDGRSGVNELLQGKEGTTIPGLSVRFEVPDPAKGAYAFVLRGKYGPGGTQVEGELPFQIP